MTSAIAIMAPGEMGSTIGRSFANSPIRVLTNLAGRSARSAERARDAGFEAVGDDATLVAQSRFLLSVVPPAEAIAMAERFAPAIAASANKPIYIDCNAIAPQTARHIAGILAPSGCDVLDGVLFGGPTSLKPGVIIHVSGPGAERARELAGPQLTVHTIVGPVGAASALKLCFAGINKGYIALGAAMIRAAIAAGCEENLVAQLRVSHQPLLDYMARAVPPMLPKAHRWEGEMREIASFMGPDTPMTEVFEALSDFYAGLGRAVAKGGDAELDALVRTLTELR